jgi:transposase-like protein
MGNWYQPGSAKNRPSQQSCANSLSWQMHCCATVQNGMNTPLDQYGYSAIAVQSMASRASLTLSTRPILRPTVQTCIVHLVRHSLNFCGWKDRKVVAKDLKRIYQATDDIEAKKALANFEAGRGQKYPSIAPSWRRAWQEVIPFFAFPPAVRKIINTTNAIESLNRVIRKTTRTRGSFPTDDAATKLIYLAIRSFEKAGRCIREWPLTHASMCCR